MNEVRGNGCLYIKGGFRINFPLFLNWPLRKFKFLSPMVDIVGPPPHRVISQVTPLCRYTWRILKYLEVKRNLIQRLQNNLHIAFHITESVLWVNSYLTRTVLRTNLMFVCPHILSTKWFVRPTWCNKYDLLINQYFNMFRALLCPSSEAQGRIILHMFFSTVKDK